MTEVAGWIRDSELLSHAYELAARAHADQLRATDRSPFLDHVVEVATILHESGADESLVAVGLLHDSVERGTLGELELRDAVDGEISALVFALSENEAIAEFDQRKAALREQVRGAGPKAATVFAADKLSDIRGLRRGMSRFEDSIERSMGTSVESMAAHYAESVTVVEEGEPACSFLPALRRELDELSRLGAPSRVAEAAG
jgi:(p)ppGpp synthase/HD superfamily hydrolase